MNKDKNLIRASKCLPEAIYYLTGEYYDYSISKCLINVSVTLKEIKTKRWLQIEGRSTDKIVHKSKKNYIFQVLDYKNGKEDITLDGHSLLFVNKINIQ